MHICAIYKYFSDFFVLESNLLGLTEKVTTVSFYGNTKNGELRSLSTYYLISTSYFFALSGSGYNKKISLALQCFYLNRWVFIKILAEFTDIYIEIA